MRPVTDRRRDGLAMFVTLVLGAGSVLGGMRVLRKPG